MRHALSQPLGVGRLAGRSMMAARPESDGAERLLRRQQAAEELRQVTRQILKMACGSLCSGSISQSNCQMSISRRSGSVVMHNNHGSGSLCHRKSDDASNCLVDRCDSDSLPIDSESPYHCWTSKDEALEEEWHYQQENQMIIPKLLHLDTQPLQSQLPLGHRNCQHIRRHQGRYSRGSSSDSNDEILGIGLGAANTLSRDASANSHNLMAFKPTTCTAVSGRREQTRSDPQQQTVKPSSPKPPPRTKAANVRSSQAVSANEIYCAAGEQGCNECQTAHEAEKLESLPPPQSVPLPPPPSPPPPPSFCQRIDRQVVAVSLDGPSDRRRRRSHTTTTDLFPTTCEGSMQAANDAFADSLKRQVNFIEQLSSLQRQPLCTSSSNCCGGRRNRSSARAADAADVSLDSSLNLYSGAAVLCRPGSLPDINIDGLSARRMRCPHGNGSTSGVDSREELEYKLHRSTRDRRGKKRVSFSASVQKDNDSEGPIGSFHTSDSGSSRVNKMTFDMVNTDTEVSEIDSDSREYVKPKRSSLRGRGGANTVEVLLKPTPLPPLPPPPPPPHAKDDTLTSCSLDYDSTIQLAAGQDFYPSDTVPDDDQISTDSRGSNIELAIGKAFTNSEAEPKGQSVSSSFKLTTEKPKPKAESQDSGAAVWPEGVHTELRNRSNVAAGPPRTKGKSSGLRKVDSADVKQSLNKARDGSKNLGARGLGSNLGGSNCANSAIGHNHHDSKHRVHHHQHHHHQTRMQQQAATRSTSHYSQVTGEVTASSDATREHRRAGEDESSYVIFQHPPEVSTGKQMANVENGGCHDAPIDDEEYSESITFSWITTVDKESNGVDVSVSVNNNTHDFEQTTSSRHNSITVKRRDGSAEKVTFNRLCTAEDRLTSIKTAAVTSAKIGDVRGDACVKPSAVRDSVAVCAVANCVVRSTSAEHVYTYDDSSDSDDSSQPFLMLEALSCGHKDLDSNGCSISCRCYSPPRQARQLTPSPRPSPPPPAAAPPTMPPPPPPPPSSPPRSGSSVSAAANAMRDLLTGVCDPAEAAALTQALVRGLVCNVESLRSALAATLMLLKDSSRKCTGPLAQAIGTADALEDLIQQVQASQQRRSRRLPGSGDQGRRRDRSRANSGSDCNSGDASATEDDESNAVFGTADRRRDDVGGGRLPAWTGGAVGSQRSSASCAPVGRPQCYAMAHYLVGEQSVEPSLEHRPSLECRPATTRVVRTGNRAINLTSDVKQRRR